MSTQNLAEAIHPDESVNDLGILRAQPVRSANMRDISAPAAVTGRLIGFSLNDQPLISSLRQLPGEIVTARSTVPLSTGQLGCAVLVLFEDGDIHLPIVVGVLQPRNSVRAKLDQLGCAIVESDNERILISAEREIVLRCGDASITLTRAGKVVIDGSYVLSRSTGYIKIKGAAVDIN